MVIDVSSRPTGSVARSETRAARPPRPTTAEGAAPETLAAAGELLRTLGHPLRLAIVDRLGRGPHCVHELVDALDASQPLVSQHLRLLRAGRIVRTERRGREVVYRLDDEHVAHIVHDAIRHAHEGSNP